MPFLFSLSAVCAGAAAGALCRWSLSALLNPLFTAVALGTLAANLSGCLIMGIFMGIFADYPKIAEGWRLLLVTGFLGSFTTFSAFSGEAVAQLAQAKWAAGFAVIALHTAGGLLCTFAGMVLWKNL